jgi:FkbM family methyltransferase
VWGVSGIARLLPTRFWLEVRGKTQLVRRADYQGAAVLLRIDSVIENDVRLREAHKEPGTVRWIEQWIRPGEVLFDIGANVGSYSLIAFCALRGNARIYAFEPGFTTFPQLCHNTYINKAGGSITPFQVALSDRTALVSFHYSDLQPGSALHALEVPKDWRGDDFKPVFSLPITAYRLDDFVQQFGLPEPNHLKIDVDGNECQILQGAGELLGSPTLRTVLIEADENYEYAAEVTALLTASGLALHTQFGPNSLYVRR